MTSFATKPCGLRRRIVLLGAETTVLALATSCQPPVRDFLITDVRYLQGDQIADQVANVGITGDKITYIGSERVRARTVIPGKGLILTPGLIDANSSGWLRDSAAMLKLPESTSHEPFSRRSPDIALSSANYGLVRR